MLVGMAVLSGTATIRFGVADTSSDLDLNTHGSGQEPGGIEVQASAGDIFVIPAGIAHKTFNSPAGSTFELLSPGDGHRIQAEEMKSALGSIDLSGFVMLGAYPFGSVWDFQTSGDAERFAEVHSVAKPESDPVLGNMDGGLCKLWS